MLFDRRDKQWDIDGVGGSQRKAIYNIRPQFSAKRTRQPMAQRVADARIRHRRVDAQFDAELMGHVVAARRQQVPYRRNEV